MCYYFSLNIAIKPTQKANNTDNLRTTIDKTVTGAINELNSNKSNLTTTPQSTTANITYYVDHVNGLDTKNGLTSGTAFKTIQYAINKLPQIINHAVVINRLAGTNWEDISIKGFCGSGGLTITGANDYTTASTFICNSIEILFCSLKTIINGLAPNNGGGTYGIRVEGCQNVYINSINDTLAYSRYGLLANNSNVNITNSIISSKSKSISSENNDSVTSVANSGTGNIITLYTVGGTIMKASTQPSGTTSELIYNGGVIR